MFQINFSIQGIFHNARKGCTYISAYEKSSIDINRAIKFDCNCYFIFLILLIAANQNPAMYDVQNWKRSIVNTLILQYQISSINDNTLIFISEKILLIQSISLLLIQIHHIQIEQKVYVYNYFHEYEDVKSSFELFQDQLYCSHPSSN
ncbi:hypothetical protein pb186bvf_004362 [Paramecium bursaria]